MGDAVAEEGVLLDDHFAGDLEDGLGALVERLDQPVGIGEFLREPAALGLAAGLLELGIVGAVDDQARQRRLVERNGPAGELPLGIEAGAEQHVGRDRLDPGIAEAQAGLGIVAAQLGEHPGEILLVDPAHAPDPGELAARNQVEIVDQPRHGGIKAVGLAGLERDAFAKAPRADAGGIESLDQPQRRFGLVLGYAKLLGQIAQGHGQIAGLVELADDVHGDCGEARIAGGGADLGLEVLCEAGRGSAALVDAGPFLAATGAKVPAPVGIEAVAVAVERGRVDIERPVVGGAAFADQLVGGRAFQAGSASFDRLRMSGVGFCIRCLAEIEQRIGIERLADEHFDFEVRQRQQLDRLLQLGGHHQRLAQ